MTDKEIKIQLALGTLDIKHLTIKIIKNIDDIELIQQLCNKVPKCWTTKSILEYYVTPSMISAIY